ncbi:MAG: type I DNA topoisomerase [Ruminococcaceae bacterium]|nr:type I DNA topoisomerase [Oscillospiraceae bacterium]
MKKTLVIVESPAKANTIKNYLGSGYKVVASKGHLRDLPKSTFGIDIENNYEPKYINIRGKGSLINELKKEAKTSQQVFLATDPDREGEAISWHLAQMLGLDIEKPNRVTFNEITKNAVRSAIASPQAINMDKVNSQQARRIVDRIVGYKLSPLLWKKVRNGLSAGRVQSVATKMIVEREEEIAAFVREEYWTIDAKFLSSSQKSFKAYFYGNRAGKTELADKQAADKVLNALDGAAFHVDHIKKSKKTKNPPAPFITSQLQQDAYRRLNFQSIRTMRIAQELYEGIVIGNKGEQGLITYMRTDSTRISDEAQAAAKSYIVSNYGENYYPSVPNEYKSKKKVQDAHEAIRPADVNLRPDDIKPFLTNEQYKLYKLIWERFIASQMSPALYDTLSVDIVSDTKDEYVFRASGDTLKFAGFTTIYKESTDNDEPKQEKASKIPALSDGEPVTLEAFEPAQNFTQPPQRYTEATLIKAMEEKGIGRPSTYSPTLSTIISRGYAEREGKFLKPKPLGTVTTDIMRDNFATVVDYKFTANMEDDLDAIENGEKDYKKIVDEFYGEFNTLLKKAESTLQKEEIDVPVEKLDVKCEKCGGDMVIKRGRFGRFAACANYPQCRNTKPLDKTGNIVAQEPPKPVEGMKCPECGSDVFLRSGAYGEYYACAKYPECKYTKQIQKKIGVKCPKCGGDIVEKRGKKKIFYGCDNYPNCDFSTWNMPTDKKCPECGSIMALHKYKAGDKLVCINTECGHKEDAAVNS